MSGYLTAMKILLCHNFYQQPGGEDKVFADEGALLESHGHQVLRYQRHNDDVGSMGRLELGRKTIWNDRTWQEVGVILERERPHIMHCTNTFPLISPSIYYRAKSLGVSVVQSLHNYRIVCPKAQLMRGGSVCEKCLGKRIAWPALTHRCYRDSLPATAVVVSMLARHWKKGTWQHAVDRYIALTEFAKQKLVQGGLPEEKIMVKPNFISFDPGVGEGGGDYAIFVGRLSPEKGISTLLTAWGKLKNNLKLKILGDGPLAQEVATAALEDPRIEWMGHQTMQQVYELIGEARFLVMPSVWYETFGLTVIESFAKGTPVAVSQIGALNELVRDGETGFKFTPGDPESLVKTINKINRLSDMSSLRAAARGEYELKFNAATNYRQLMDIYESAIEAAKVGNCQSPAFAKVK